MKIESGLLSAYTLGNRRTNGDSSLPAGETATGRNIPTVAPAGAIPSGLANALWLANARLEKAQDESDSLIADFEQSGYFYDVQPRTDAQNQRLVMEMKVREAAPPLSADLSAGPTAGG